MHYLSLRSAVLLAFLIPVSAGATCSDHFAAQRQPSSTREVTLLCSLSFATGYSAQAKEAAWSAEHLTADSIAQAEALKGRAEFQEDLRIPLEDRSGLMDYKRSGWSRGHLTPSGDVATENARAETFLLSNIVPQAARLNSGAWNHLEANVRKIVKRYREVYVVTGPAFRAPLGTIGPDHVRIPSSLWKTVYVPSSKAVSVIVCKNTAPYRCNAVSQDSLERVTGIDPFPGVALSDKNRSVALDRALLP
ncbi:DNA/RNA non-specific endonuclease [Acetobacter sp.]|jgi:endonuclease G|nr:DNA/RNA non-specific endonuclease [Acetobacter sp.]MCI1300420.1 DNA/RNA non-specific endonuclease [Acetobacter sp.]MCI1316761.1 DNA/RNA non-specific endonuclease [Acetobacter sp.]